MSSIFSILSAGATGQTPVAGQTHPLGPPGVAFETFLLTAQDRVEYPPAAASGTSTPLEAPEKTGVAGQSDFEGDLSLESGLRALPSNGLLDPPLHPLAPPEGPADDLLTVGEENPTQGLLPASDTLPAQKERPTASGAQDKGYASGPLAVLLSPSGSDEGSEKEGVRDREAALSGDGDSGASFALETSRTAPVFQEEKNSPFTESPLITPSFVLSRPEAPWQGRVARTETVERGREAEAQTPETGPSDAPSEGLPPPASPLPETEAAGIVHAEEGQSTGADDAGGDLRSPASNARRDETAGDESGALSGDDSGQVLVREAREAALADLTANEKPSDGPPKTPPVPGPPQRKGTKTGGLSVGTPAGEALQNMPLSLLAQPPLPAPPARERTEDALPEMAGAQRPETRNPLPPPLAPTPERPAFAPATEKEGASEADPEGSARSPEPRAVMATVGAIGDRPQEGVRIAAPAQGTPDGKAERPSGSRPANAPVTARRAPVVEGIGDRPQEGHGQEAGQAIAAPIKPPETGMVRSSDTRTDGKSAGSPAGSGVRPSDVKTDARSATSAPIETQGRVTQKTAPPDGESAPPGEQARTTGDQRPETQGGATEKAAPFHREVEPPVGQTRAISARRPEQGDESPLEALSGPATLRVERAAPGQGHEGKSDRQDAQEGERPAADQAVPFSSPSGDPFSLKTPPKSSSVSTASAQHQSAISAAGPSPAGARVHTPEAATVEVPAPPPEAVVRQVIRGARFLLKDDVSEVRVRLEPPELGSVHIRLVSGGDTLSGEIGVSNPDVKGIVESHLHQLRSSLTEQGLRVGHIDVSVRDDQRGGAWSDRTGGFGHPGNAPDDRRSRGRNGSPAWEAPEENRRPWRSQGLVDYFA